MQRYRQAEEKERIVFQELQRKQEAEAEKLKRLASLPSAFF